MNSAINIPAFVICLERETERKAYIKEHLSSLNIPFVFSKAVDGRVLSKIEKDAIYSEEESIKTRGRPLADGELGCYMSHYKIWQHMVKNSIETALIIESDAVFSSEAIEVINQIELSNVSWDLIMLYYRECFPSFWEQRKLTNETNLVKFANKCSCTTAYLLTLAGAKQLLKFAMPICLPVDDYMTGGFINKDIKTFAAYPRTVQLTDDNESTSTIKQGVNSIKNLTKKRKKHISFAKKVEKRLRYFSKQVRPGSWL